MVAPGDSSLNESVKSSESEEEARENDEFEEDDVNSSDDEEFEAIGTRSVWRPREAYGDVVVCRFFPCREDEESFTKRTSWPSRSRRTRRHHHNETSSESPPPTSLRSRGLRAEHHRQKSVPGSKTRARCVQKALNELPVDVAKNELLDALEANDGEPRSAAVQEASSRLAREARFLQKEDAPARRATGTWKALTRAHFPGGGKSSESLRGGSANYEYTLGRMSFGLFAPRDAVVRVDACYNMVRPLDLFETPRSVPDAVSSRSDIRKYNIKVRFTVVDSRARGLKGTITTYGYCAPSLKAADDAAHRLDCWFVAGDLAPDSFRCDDDATRWADLFGKQAAEDHLHRGFVTRATLWFVSIALGIRVDPVQKTRGYQSYVVQRPVTGHVDVLYSDDDLRVTRGNRNSLVVLRRVNKHHLDFHADADLRQASSSSTTTTNNGHS
mmetsp:Transcript_13731/g.41535  ORF Transcript_13731/g.41535 Transcript_13731/m.41535 type:complete len:442 (-) Transcript_13731:303-1628(-)